MKKDSLRILFDFESQTNDSNENFLKFHIFRFKRRLPFGICQCKKFLVQKKTCKPFYLYFFDINYAA